MTTPDYGTFGSTGFTVSLDKSVAVITLKRAKQRNTLTEKQGYELKALFEHIDKDDRVRVIILTAEPNAPAFCSGAELSGSWDSVRDTQAEQQEDPISSFRDSGGQTGLAILRCRKITIVAVNGHAAGVGMTMQLSFDFRFVWGGAKLTFPFILRGICPEALSSYLLPRLIGYSRANALFLSGDVFYPSSPIISDLFFQILENREDVLPAALKFAHRLASTTSATSVAITKALIWHGKDTVEEQHLLESRAIKYTTGSKDAEEGAVSFLEKRKPDFKATLSSDLPSWVPWWDEIDVGRGKAKL
ncbi:peroxisomal enoyl- -hydratase [Pyrrhoderma noxium]|uniref:Peroxisomal enoyl--hydratase n=1 Tax=Pyrrhoderma noxium TaxID=2282107 RepID=A0A286U9V1_9AGAM|nr:peroxisomal enoyl- -hydratase [Pyrrhoderma noxium]